MTTSVASTTTSGVNLSSSTSRTGTSSASDTTASADRFLKLLVAQMQNQDPLNPMDNAQVTSQMAQINTVTGIEKLNTSVQTLQSQFVQMQSLQGASLVGHDVIVPGNRLDVNSTTGVGQGGFELASAADAVKVEILSSSGAVVETLNLGAAGIGMHSFDWNATSASAASSGRLTFRVTATSGGTSVAATALMRDQVTAVQANGSTLTLELSNSGSLPYTSVRAFN